MMSKSGKFNNEQQSVSTANFDDFMDDIDEYGESSNCEGDDDIDETTTNTEQEELSTMSPLLPGQQKLLQLQQQHQQQLQQQQSQSQPSPKQRLTSFAALSLSPQSQDSPSSSGHSPSLQHHQHQKRQDGVPVSWISPAAAALAKEEAKQHKKRQRRQSTGCVSTLSPAGGGGYGGSNHNSSAAITIEQQQQQHFVTKEAVVALHCAATAAQTFEMHFGSLKNQQRENSTPLYHAHEIQTCETPLRHMGFFSEYSLRGIRLLETKTYGAGGRKLGRKNKTGKNGDIHTSSTDDSTNHNDDDYGYDNDDEPLDQQEAARQRFWERIAVKDEQDYYCVKYLQGGLMGATDHGGTAAADMIFETRILMNLTPQHPNICVIYGVNAGGIDTFLETTVKDGFFVITDKITELLPERIETWRKREKTSSSSSGSVSSKKKSSSSSKQHAGSLSERLDVALDVSSALQFLHDRQIVYHIRPDKIGFEAKNEGRVKLCNFSQARYNGMRDHQTKAITSSDDAIHVLAYTAPEVLCKATCVTTAADVYGFGILLYELTALSHPFPEYQSRALHWEHVVQRHERPVLNPKWSKELRTLMESCWDPFLRLEMHKVHENLEHILLQMSEDQQQDRMQKVHSKQKTPPFPRVLPENQPPLVSDRFAAPTAQHQKMPRRNSTGGALPVPTSVSLNFATEESRPPAPPPRPPASPPPASPAVIVEEEEVRSGASCSKKDKKGSNKEKEKSSRSTATVGDKSKSSSRSTSSLAPKEDDKDDSHNKRGDKNSDKSSKDRTTESTSKRKGERGSFNKKEKESESNTDSRSERSSFKKEKESESNTDSRSERSSVKKEKDSEPNAESRSEKSSSKKEKESEPSAESRSEKNSFKKEKESEPNPESPRRQRTAVPRPGLQGRRGKSEKGGGTLSAVLDQSPASPFCNSDAKSVSTSVSKTGRRSKGTTTKGSLQGLRDVPAPDAFSGSASVSGGTVATSASSRKAKSSRRRISGGHVPASSPQRKMLYKHTDEGEEEEEDMDNSEEPNSPMPIPWQNQFQAKPKLEEHPSSPPVEPSGEDGIARDRFGLHVYAVKPPDSDDTSNRDESTNNEEEGSVSSPAPKSPLQRIRNKLKSIRGSGTSRTGVPLAGNEDEEDQSNSNSNSCNDNHNNNSKRSQRREARGMPLQIPEPATASPSMLDYVKKAGVFSKAGRRASVA